MQPRILVILIAIASLTASLHGQVVDMQKDGVALVKCTGLWRFHTGDDPDGSLGWAKPTFDDSSWSLIRADAPWTEQGFPGYSGFGWYRFQLVPLEANKPLGLYVSRLRTSYQVFADGKLIWQFGGLPPKPKVLNGRIQQTIPIPKDLIVPGHPIQIAIRVWHWKPWAEYVGGGPNTPVRIGELDELKEYKHLQLAEVYRLESQNHLNLVLSILLTAFGFSLFAFRGSDLEYFWFGSYECLTAIVCALEDYRWSHMTSLITFSTTLWFIDNAAHLCFLLFICRMIRAQRTFLYWLAVVSACLLFFVPPFAPVEWASPGLLRAVSSFLGLINALCVILLLVRGVRVGNRDAGLLLWAEVPAFAALFPYYLQIVAQSSGHPGLAAHFNWTSQISSWPFPVSLWEAGYLLETLILLAILLLRARRSKHEQERMAADLDAARTVQEALIPRNVPVVPGVQIHCAYHPADEVGGDFFQIVPLAGDEVLITIGDVSGKGLRAAITASMLVGSFRSVAEFTRVPSQILAVMNGRMIGGNQGGFATCLVTHIAADGTTTIANAGHISPYLDGQEVTLHNGLPLGLDASTTYPSSILPLKNGEQLAFLTDGVVEARNSTGELLGFDRTAAIAVKTADAIAAAAQSHGQTDDITVITLKRVVAHLATS